jgi:Family of unknown function (DUF6111)
MLRILAFELSLFLLPFALFGLWRLGMSASKKAEAPPTPIVPMAIAGGVLAIVGFFILVLINGGEGSDEESRYVPPSLNQDGVVHGNFSREPGERTRPAPDERPFGKPDEDHELTPDALAQPDGKGPDEISQEMPLDAIDPPGDVPPVDDD